MSPGGAAPLRVLVVAAHEAWPLDSGGRLHLYHVLGQLARRAQVTLALPLTPVHADRLPRNIRVVPVPSATPGGRSAPPAAGRGPGRAAPHDGLIGALARRHFGFRHELADWLARRAHRRRFDVTLLNGAVSGLYAPWCRTPVVWNPQDELVLPTLRAAENAGPRARLAAVRGALLYALYERHVARRAAATVFVSTLDAAYARRWCGAARLEVVQNGVDFDYFRPAATPPTPGTVAFIGALDFPPNVDAAVHFARHIWPTIHARDPQRRLLLVGRRPAATVCALAAQPGVTLAADVPDVRPWLARAAVVVVPVRQGGGLKNKILEACAVGRPVVASPRALAGLSARRGVDLLAADRPATWTAQVERLLACPALAERIAAAGQAWVRRAHSWAATGARFAGILAAAARRGRRRSAASPAAPRPRGSAGAPAAGPGAVRPRVPARRRPTAPLAEAPCR